MSDIPNSVYIREVGPREGFQFEKGPIPTARKVELVDQLSGTGVRYIQVTNFAHPKWVPQMADADEVAAQFHPIAGVRYDAIYLNERGLARAVAAGKFDLRGVLNLTASDTFSKRNTNKTIAETLEALPGQIKTFEDANVPLEGIVVMAAFGCNYEGDIPQSRVLDLIARALEIAANRGHRPRWLQLADTMGWANPLQIKRMIAAVRERWGDAKINLHLHDTRGTGLANVYAALEMGVDEFDAAVAGLGGCPFAGHREAAGNVCSEDIVFLCEEMGIETGIDLEVLIACARLAEEIVGHPLPGKVMRGGSLSRYRKSASSA